MVIAGLGEIVPDAVTIRGNWANGDDGELTGTTVPVFLINFYSLMTF
jgi:hypothetical protein